MTGVWRGIAAAGLILAIDRGLKWWALALELEPGGLTVGPFLRIVRLWNTGINFGLLADGSGLLLAGIAVTVGVALLVWTAHSRDWIHNLACGAVSGGAIGNALDRIVYGAVHDFLNVSCCGIANPYAFNFADIAIVSGVLALVLRRR